MGLTSSTVTAVCKTPSRTFKAAQARFFFTRNVNASAPTPTLIVRNYTEQQKRSKPHKNSILSLDCGLISLPTASPMKIQQGLVSHARRTAKASVEAASRASDYVATGALSVSQFARGLVDAP